MSEISRRLDQVATVLIGAVAATAGALALLGVGQERVWLLLDEDAFGPAILTAAALALLAIALALASLMLPPTRAVVEVVLLGLGVVAYLAGLTVAMTASARAADVAGRPSLVSVEVTPSPLVVTSTARAQNLDRDQRIGLRVVADGTPLAQSSAGPGSDGSATLTVAVPVPDGHESVTVLTWRLDDGEPPSCDPTDPGRASCAVVAVD